MSISPVNTTNTAGAPSLEASGSGILLGKRKYCEISGGSDEKVEQVRKRRLTISDVLAKEPCRQLIPFGDVTAHLNRDGNKRMYTSSNANTTAARSDLRWVGNGELGLDHLINTEVNPTLDTPESQHLRDRIVDHASRRVELFYYLALVYYKEQVTVERDTTNVQHGVGPYYGTAAAHSCILPNVKDNFFERFERMLNNRGVSPAYAGRLQAFGMSEAQIQELEVRLKARMNGSPNITIASLFPGVDLNAYICKDTTLFQSMNATMVLPKIVNDFDMCIERVMRDRALELLNQCSKEGLHPYEATRVFVSEMQAFLMSGLAEMKLQKLELVEEMFLIEEAMVLAESKMKGASLDDQAECLAAVRCYLRTCWKYERLIHKLRSLKDSNNIVSKCTWRHGALTPFLKSLKPYMQCTKSELDNQLGEVMERTPSIARNLVRDLAEKLRERTFYPRSRDYLRGLVQSLTGVIDAQLDGTVLPLQEVLSGVMNESGKRVPMNNEQLFRQKMQLITRCPLFIYEDDDFPKESVFPKKKE